MKKHWVLSYPLSAQRRLWSDWADAQAESESLLGAHVIIIVLSWDGSNIVQRFNSVSPFKLQQQEKKKEKKKEKKNNNKKQQQKQQKQKKTTTKRLDFQTVPDNLSETNEDMCDIWEGFKINTVETVRQ